MQELRLCGSQTLACTHTNTQAQSAPSSSTADLPESEYLPKGEKQLLGSREAPGSSPGRQAGRQAPYSLGLKLSVHFGLSTPMTTQTSSWHIFCLQGLQSLLVLFAGCSPSQGYLSNAHPLLFPVHHPFWPPSFLFLTFLCWSLCSDTHVGTTGPWGTIDSGLLPHLQFPSTRSCLSEYLPLSAQ